MIQEAGVPRRVNHRSPHHGENLPVMCANPGCAVNLGHSCKSPEKLLTKTFMSFSDQLLAMDYICFAIPRVKQGDRRSKRTRAIGTVLWASVGRR